MSNNSLRTEILKNIFSRNNIIIYIITFMISTIGMQQNISPFSIAILGASLSAGVPAIGIVIAGLLGNFVGIGIEGALNYMIMTILLLTVMSLIPPKENDEYKNEQMKISIHILVSAVLVLGIKLFIEQFTIGDLLSYITFAILSVVFYKIFVNSLIVIKEFKEKSSFSIEEVIGASLLLSIAISALGDLSIFELSIKNILSILIVLTLGWKNGILIGTTSGVTIGVTLGIISQNEPIIVAIYAISGMISGVLNKFGKIGVIIGFLLGNFILMYISNGQVSNYIVIKEALIASLGLLLIPRWIGINIEELTKQEIMLPENNKRALDKSKETINQLNMVSETIKNMAETYTETKEKNENIIDFLEKNKTAFIKELLNNLDNLEDNILYDDLTNTENPILKEIFETLVEKQEIDEKDLMQIFEKYNNYIIQGTGNVNKKLEEDINKIIKAINEAYKTSKKNFIWEEKVKTSKKNVQAQLDGVSKAISSIAVKIEEEIKKEEDYIEIKKEAIKVLEMKNIKIEDVDIIKKENRYYIDVYLDNTNKIIENSDIDKIKNGLEKVVNEKLTLNDVKMKKQNNKQKKYLSYISEDKYVLQIGQASTTKKSSIISGDSIIHTRLNDGKYLVAISDGMGSGPEARKSSQIAIKMLERLLMTGFDKDTSIDLINSTIMNTNEEIFATLDIAIIDLYNGKIEFIKNGACPTYIKNGKKVQIVKSLSLPAGILKDINLTTYDKDLENKDLIVMCSDGIIDSNVEYKNKELWLKYMLEDIETDNSQKIADIILNESVDNYYGIAKDDMSIIVCKIIKK